MSVILAGTNMVESASILRRELQRALNECQRSKKPSRGRGQTKERKVPIHKASESQLFALGLIIGGHVGTSGGAQDDGRRYGT